MRQTFAQQLIETQEAERRRVARELHDEIGQVLTVIKIDLQVVQSSTEAASFALQLHESIGLVDRALQQVRDLAFDLRPALLDDWGWSRRCAGTWIARHSGQVSWQSLSLISQKPVCLRNLRPPAFASRKRR